MRFFGIDIAAETHVIAAVGEAGETLIKPTSFAENAAGYETLFKLLGAVASSMVVMEATGHYWQNLFARLVANGFSVAVLNPFSSNHFAKSRLTRAKTDRVDALGLAHFAFQSRPPATRIPDEVTQNLRELVRMRARFVQDFGDRTRQLHRLVDLGFPEFKRLVGSMDTELVTTLLQHYPTAKAFQSAATKEVAKLNYGVCRRVGKDLAQKLVATAKVSVGEHHGPAYTTQIQYMCEDMEVLRKRLKILDEDLANTLETHEVGKLLTTIDGIGPQTAATIIATVGDPADFRDANALAAYVGVVPATSQSGKRSPHHAGITPIGNAKLRRALWMPTLSAVQHNPWLRAFYAGLRARGKLPKVALIAAMRKLLTAVYSVAKNRKPFVPHLKRIEEHV